jgi:hypothetical protein
MLYDKIIALSNNLLNPNIHFYFYDQNLLTLSMKK